MVPVEPGMFKNDNPKKVIGVSMMDMKQQYFVSMVEGIKDVAAKNGIELSIQSQDNDSGRQNNQIENFIQMKVDGMILCTVDGEAADQLVKQAKDAKVPTIAQGIKIKNAAVWQNWIEFDYGYSVGKMAGEWINERYPNEAVVECGVIGYDLTPQLKARTEGISKGLTDTAKNSKVVSVQASDSMQKAMEVCENWLKEFPNMRVFACMDDDNGGIGCNETLNSALGPDKYNDYGVFAADGVPQAIKAIKEKGYYKGTVYINPFKQGQVAVECLLKLWKGEALDSFILIQSNDYIDYDQATTRTFN